MRYTIKYINAANEVINYLHTDDFSKAVNTEFELRDKGYDHQSVWIDDEIGEIQEILDINEYEYDLEVLARQMNEFEKKGLKKFNEELLNSFTYNK